MTIFNIYLIIPKDLKTKDLDKSFVHASCTKSCKFIREHINAVKNNKIIGRHKYVHDNGGLDHFNIILLETIDCHKDEINMHKMYHQTTVDSTINIIKKIINES
jgi:hypothetical protein